MMKIVKEGETYTVGSESYDFEFNLYDAAEKFLLNNGYIKSLKKSTCPDTVLFEYDLLSLE